MRRTYERIRRWLPWIALVAMGLLVADEALAQSTGGSFGGGSFGGGGGGGGGGGFSGGGGDDGGGDLLTFIIYIVFSRLPWPLKIGLIVVAVGGWGAFKYAKNRRNRSSHDDDDDGIP